MLTMYEACGFNPQHKEGRKGGNKGGREVKIQIESSFLETGLDTKQKSFLTYGYTHCGYYLLSICSVMGMF